MPLFLKRLTRQSDPGATWLNLSRVTVTVGILCIPVLVLSWTVDVWETTKAMVLFVTVGLGWIFYFLGILRAREHHWMMTRLDWAAVAVWASYGLSSLTSVNRWQSLVGLSGSLVDAFPVVTAMVGLYFLTSQVFRTRAEQRAAFGAVLTGLGLALVFQIFQFSDFSLLTPSLPRSNTIFSVFSNSLSDIAVVAALFGTMILFFWKSESERWQRWSIAAGVTLSWLIVLLAGRPLGWAVWAMGMIAVVLREAARRKQANTGFIAIAVILAALGMAAQMFGVQTRAGLANGPDIALDQTTTRTIVRTSLQSRPVFGTGNTTWYQDFVVSRPLSFNQTAYWSNRFVKASNGWWQSVATIGIVGTGAWLLFIAWSAWTLWKRWTIDGDFLTLSAMVVTVTVFVSGFFTTWSLPLLILGWFFLGLARAGIVHQRVKKAQPLGLGVPTAFALVVLAVVALWFSAGRLYAAEVVVQQARAAIGRQENLDKIITRLNSALKLNARQTDAPVLLAGAYLTKAELALQANDSAAASPLVQQAIAVMKTAVSRDPTNPAIYEAMNNFLNRMNSYVGDAVDEASQNYIHLRKIEPTNPIHDVGYGQTLMIIRARVLSGEKTEATDTQADAFMTQVLAAYDLALKKKPDYPQASFAKAQALTANNQTAEAITILEPLVMNYPDIAVFWTQLGATQSKAKNNDLAVAAFEQALKLSPTDPAMYLTFAQHYQDAGQGDLAKQTLERRLKEIPGDPSLTQKLTELTVPPKTE